MRYNLNVNALFHPTAAAVSTVCTYSRQSVASRIARRLDWVVVWGWHGKSTQHAPKSKLCTVQLISIRRCYDLIMVALRACTWDRDSTGGDRRGRGSLEDWSMISALRPGLCNDSLGSERAYSIATEQAPTTNTGPYVSCFSSVRSCNYVWTVINCMTLSHLPVVCNLLELTT